MQGYKGERRKAERSSMRNQFDGKLLTLNGDSLWALLERHQRETFYTAKNLPFTYVIRGGEMFVDRRSKSITKATILKAYARVLEDHERVICGPKKLNCFGAPYVWAIFRELGVVTPRPAKTKKAEMP